MSWIPDHPGVSGSRKTNPLLNQIKQQDDGDYSIIDKIYFNVEYPYEAKYQYLIKKREKKCLENPKVSKDFIEYSDCMMSIKMLLKSTTQTENVIY